MGMEGSVARWYDKTTRKDMQRHREFAGRMKAVRPQGGDYLEVAPGPGFMAIEMARDRRFHVTGLDISATFVEIARKNAEAEGVPAEFRKGNASEMSFEANSFDVLSCSAAFKNFSEPEKALREMHRVLRPGGTGVVLDLRRDVSMDAIKRYFDNMDLSVVNRWFTIATFRMMLIKRAYTAEERGCWDRLPSQRRKCAKSRSGWRRGLRSRHGLVAVYLGG
jgi:ubiquinone/menaquinone biosynthesis C-methylase UbiE